MIRVNGFVEVVLGEIGVVGSGIEDKGLCGGELAGEEREEGEEHRG